MKDRTYKVAVIFDTGRGYTSPARFETPFLSDAQALFDYLKSKDVRMFGRRPVEYVPPPVLDYSLISEAQIDGIDTSDYPDFCDAFIASAQYGDREMTDDELDVLNDDKDFVYSQVEKRLY